MTPTHVLEQEHERILVLLSILERLARGVREGARPLEAITECLDLLRSFADGAHHGKEEQHLFPALERAGMPREAGPVAVMLMEHDLGRGELAALRDALAGLQEGVEDAPVRFSRAAARYVPLLRDHIEKENLVLFRMACDLIPPSDVALLERAYAEVDAQALGPGGYARALARVDQLASSVLGAPV
jgi:hemerythrin-like domain-containing protein